MPRQNRVTPSGQIIATPARGALMGNRGCLHDDRGRIKRLYQGRRWIFCRLRFKDRHRQIMTPGRYTELFFLDEATALAAGHRPCTECSRSRFKAFTTAWAQANPTLAGGPKITASRLDTVLHRERIAKKQKMTYQHELAQLPPGTFITLADDGQPYLLLEKALLPWTPAGYGPPIVRPNQALVQVLTPRSVVLALGQGYQLDLHPAKT